ncbi:MAG TPA: iron-containing redox enzyme family protein [Polyangia bacterium]|nr:iron-containing redox enzyme family protein [Polyangia bacterium]
MRIQEEQFLDAFRRPIAERARRAPADPDGFVAWFEELRASGPGQGDPLFPWLETTATMREMRWFLTQEVAGEAGFDDLVALAQIKLPIQPKLELARNYWDEMGRGGEPGMHGPMLARVARTLEVDLTADVVPEALALANLVTAFAVNRRYAYHAIGALGVIELTAPDRTRSVNLGLKRLGVNAHVRQYFALHSTLDIEHSIAWNREVLRPLVAQQPAIAVALAEGALMRLSAGAACFDRYRRHFGLGPS